MKNVKKKVCVFLCILICAIVSTGTLSSFDGSATVEAATKVGLSKKTAYVTKGSSTTLSLKGTSSKVKWTSSNKSIVTVNAKGKVTGVQKGTATVTAKVGKKTYKCKIVVETPGISKKSISVTVGKTASLKMNGTKQKVTWSSSNKKVVAVSNKGVVKGIKKGTAVITAKVGGKAYKCTVKVASKKVSVTGVVLSKKSLSLKVGQKETLKATVKPTNATNKKVIWKTSNSKVVKVSSGKVTAVGKGTATITATADGKTAKCTVKVTEDKIAKNTKELKDYIERYGRSNNNGGKFIKIISRYQDGSVVECGIAYEPRKNQLVFVQTMDASWGESTISMYVDIAKSHQVEPQFVLSFKSGEGCIAEAKVDATKFNKKTNVRFNVLDSYGLTNSEMQQAGNMQLQMAFKGWDSVVYEALGKSLSDLGFKAYRR